MTAIQMNAELLRNMSIIAEDENLLSRATGIGDGVIYRAKSGS